MASVCADDLLDPKSDYVFFRVFSEEPDLLVDLIIVSVLRITSFAAPTAAAKIAPGSTRRGVRCGEGRQL